MNLRVKQQIVAASCLSDWAWSGPLLVRLHSESLESLCYRRQLPTSLRTEEMVMTILNDGATVRDDNEFTLYRVEYRSLNDVKS